MAPGGLGFTLQELNYAHGPRLEEDKQGEQWP